MKRILVIEDQPQMRRNLVTVLEMEGYQPIAAENGRSGLEAARREKPDLVLCDVMMPEMDGHAVLAALRSDPAFVTTPFIFLTAKGDKVDVRAGMNLGADDYLTKPARREELLTAITTRLERAEAHAAQLQHEDSLLIFLRPRHSNDSASLHAKPKFCCGSRKAKEMPRSESSSAWPKPP